MERVRLRVNRRLERLLTVHKPIKVAVGGRGSGKSIGFGDIFTMKMENEGADIYCLREFQDSITDSVHKVFKGSINERLKLKGWDIQETRIIAPNGARTVYKGANRNPDAMQSAQDFKYSWFEEAHRASQSSIDKLLPTIIRTPGAECWFSANPQSSADPFSQRFLVPYLADLYRDGIYEDDMHIIVFVNWRDNPWWNEAQENLRRLDEEKLSRKKYEWIWEGRFNDTMEDSIIQDEWVEASIDAHIKLGFEPIGARVASFDPADEGNDEKAVAFRHGVVVSQVKTWGDGDLNTACGEAFNFAHLHKANEFVYDHVGIGAGVKVYLQKHNQGNNMRITGFGGGESPDDPDLPYENDRIMQDVFKNKRTQYWKLLADRFEKTFRAVTKGEYIDPEQLISLSSEIQILPQIKAELCSVQRKRNSTSDLMQLLTKTEMRKMGIPSQNAGDALCMLFANPAYDDQVVVRDVPAVNFYGSNASR